jgi:hypothetical protein
VNFFHAGAGGGGAVTVTSGNGASFCSSAAPADTEQVIAAKIAAPTDLGMIFIPEPPLGLFLLPGL